jgi:hypothetical protein
MFGKRNNVLKTGQRPRKNTLETASATKRTPRNGPISWVYLPTTYECSFVANAWSPSG